MDEISVDKELRRIYESYSASGLREWREIAARDKVRHIDELCHSVRHDVIVEVGAGEGAVLASLEGIGFATRMYGLDIAETAVAAMRCRNIRSLVELAVFDGYRIPYRDKQFDLAIATHVVEHVEHPLIFLRELKRVAEYVFVEIPLEYNMQGIRDRRRSRSYGHINFYDPLLARIQLERADFEILESRVRNSSLDIYRFQSGWKGIPKYVTKEVVLRTMPFLACRIFSYVFFALCR